MTTPTKEQIRERATELFNNSNRHLPSISPEDSELRENGLWDLARNDLMRNTARSEQLAYTEQLANELGFRLTPTSEFDGTETQVHDGLLFDLEETMASGIFISGTSQCGKSTLAMHLAKRLIEDNVIVFITDPTQVWFEFDVIENIISVMPLKQKKKQTINWNDQNTLFDTSRLNPFEQQKFIELFCANVMYVAINRVNRPKIIVVFEEAHTPIYNGSMRAKRSQETARLLTQGANFNVRFIAITQFSAMCDKLLVKLAQQRFFGRTTEKNDKDYLRSFLDDKVKQLEDLKRGEFLFNYGKTTKRIEVPKFEAKKVVV